MRELGAKVGASKQAVWYWETGRREPGVGHALRLARAFGVPVEEIDFRGPRRAEADGAR